MIKYYERDNSKAFTLSQSTLELQQQQFQLRTLITSGWCSEYANLYIRTQAPEGDFIDHLAHDNSFYLWFDVWSGDLQAKKREYGYTWHQMSLLRPRVIKQNNILT